jgi:hypothetical protein
MQQEVVNLVRVDDLLKGHALGPQALHQVDGLAELDVAIIIAMNQQHRRPPPGDPRHRRRLTCLLHRLGRIVPSPGSKPRGRPVVNAVKIDSRGKHVRVPRQTQSGQISTVPSSPESDASRIDLRPRPQVIACGHDVLVFRGTSGSPARCFPKSTSISGSAAKIHAEHSIPTAGEVLIHPVGIVVVIHVVPSQEHLPDRPASMNITAGSRPAGLASAPAGHESPGRPVFEDHGLGATSDRPKRLGMLPGGCPRFPFRTDSTGTGSWNALLERRGDAAMASGAGFHSMVSRGLAAGSAGHRNLPEMPPVDVAAIR